MTTMTEETFWDIVDHANWRGLIADGVKRPYEQGKKNLLEVLPLKSDMENFSHMFQKMRGQLTQVLDKFEQETGERVVTKLAALGWSIRTEAMKLGNNEDYQSGCALIRASKNAQQGKVKSALQQLSFVPKGHQSKVPKYVWNWLNVHSNY